MIVLITQLKCDDDASAAKACSFVRFSVWGTSLNIAGSGGF